MKNGDISNETSPRLIVLAEVVAELSVEDTRAWLRTTTVKKISKVNNLALSQLWNLASKYGLSVELAAFEDDGWDQEVLDSLMDRLDRRGANPFNYAEAYSNIDDFVSEIPYRANLRGIVDIRARVARYGSAGIELENL